MDAADAIIANLTPFRGAGADPGTVYELGYMAGRRKFCLAYSNDAPPMPTASAASWTSPPRTGGWSMRRG